MPFNRPELPPADVEESSIRPVPAATANAVFDASGARAAPRRPRSGSSPRWRKLRVPHRGTRCQIDSDLMFSFFLFSRLPDVGAI